jgi:hypothetical protein
MSSQSPSSFDDPELKAALKRSLGAEVAPASLRGRVEKALATEAASPPPRTLRPAAGWRNNPLVGLAAAALIVVSIGLIYTNVMKNEGGPSGLPQAMAMDMAAAHDRALANAALHELNAPKGDMNAIRDELKAKLGHPVLVASLGNDWEFQGARVASVGSTEASQLLFKNKKNNDTVSVLSVPGRDYYATEEGMEYEQDVEGHALAGFVKKGIVHCIVGSKGSKLDEDDLADVRDAVKQHLPDDAQSKAIRADVRCASFARS